MTGVFRCAKESNQSELNERDSVAAEEGHDGEEEGEMDMASTCSSSICQSSSESSRSSTTSDSVSIPCCFVS